jgi:hypothetical protein
MSVFVNVFVMFADVLAIRTYPIESLIAERVQVSE